MRDLSGDPGVFIRSMASRGTLGGLAASTARFVQALDAAGFEIILIETVGAGQAEVDIARLAHTTLVVEAPGLGDDIQAIKAGILEIADILVINKADRPGVEAAERALRSMLLLAQPTPQEARHHGSIPEADPAQSASRSTISGIDPMSAWQTPIVKTVASEGAGIAELVETIRKHRHYLVQNGGWQQREQARLKVELDTLVRENLITGWRRSLPGGHYEQVLERLYRRDVSPRQAVSELLGEEK
jgi:LAO/AO transport system kinase